MAHLDHPIHGVLVEQLDLAPGQTLLDLGCGTGGTLHRALATVPGISAVGIDSNEPALDQARSLLSGLDARFECANLARPLNLPDGSINRIVCHNVLECLADPVSLLVEAGRLLAPDGRAIWSHVDFAGIVVTAVDEQVNRAVLAAYSDFVQPWMDYADGHMGRKLPGLFSDGPLRVEHVSVHTNVARELQGDALARVDEIAAVLTNNAANGLAKAEVHRWRSGLDRLASDGKFFFMEPTIIVTSLR